MSAAVRSILIVVLFALPAAASEVLRGVIHTNPVHHCTNQCDDFTITIDSTGAILNIQASFPIILSDNEHAEVVGTRIPCGGCTTFNVTQLTVLPPLSVLEQGRLPQAAALGQNYPNPFNPQTTLTYSLPSEAAVSLSVYNSLGQEVARLVDGAFQPPASYAFTWNSAGMPSGIYFSRLSVRESGGLLPHLLMRPMVLLR